MEDFENKSFFKKYSLWFIMLTVLVILGVVVFKGWDKVVIHEIDGTVIITGNFSCLPLKADVDKNKACALGVKSRDGLYYALDVSHIQDANSDLKVEDTIAVTGTLRPDTPEPRPEWADYDVKGVVLVNTVLRTR
jgi:hypothetical protein